MRQLSLIFFLIVAMTSIQTGASLAKEIFPVLGAVGISFLRIVFAAILLILVFRPWRKRMDRNQLQAIILYGVSLGGMNVLFYLALERMPLGITVALEFVGPLAVSIFSSRRKIDLFWALLAIIGIFLVMPIFHVEKSDLDPLGILFALASACFWAFYMVFGKRARSFISAGRLVSLGMVVAALTLLPLYLMTENKLEALNFEVLQSSLCVGLLSSAIPYFLESYVIEALPLTTFGILMSLEPVIAALLGIFLLQENITFLQWSAIGCIILASMGSSLVTRRETPPPDLPN
ncbi:MAG: transporter [Verrucomicrobia bacterium RIFCSPHIGHO2_12_FULL_41_10]|nr:MAG: transporter [Verrucomicrobia bacterium RIFCSPHIGHO2_12_FULL_41_10]